jgi:amidohydrolase
MEIKKKIETYTDELIDLYRDFHTHPELGFEEFRSQEKVMNYLSGLDLNPKKIASTGVFAELKGVTPGPTILLRTDMDAIPVTEETNLPHASQSPGVMHACGHDGHMAMMMIAAKVLTGMRDKLSGTIKFLFQPNEEDAGAYKVVEEGIMNSPKVDSVFGLHLWSQCPIGQIDIVDGAQMAASYYFDLKVKGRGGHAGFAHESTDPVFIASLIMQAVQGIQTRENNALDPAVIIFTQMNAGTSTTIVPETAVLKGSIRFLFEDGKKLFKRFEDVVSHICAAYQAEYELGFQKGNDLLCNNPQAASVARTAAAEVVGQENVTSNIRTMAGEDFSDYLAHAPGAFAFIGFNNPEKNADFPHHHPKFQIDEDALAIGVEYHVRTALKILNT